MIKKVSEIVEMPEYHNIDGAIITRHQHDLVERCVGSQDVGKKQIEAKIDVNKLHKILEYHLGSHITKQFGFDLTHELIKADCITLSEVKS